MNTLGKAPVFSLLSNPADNPSRPSPRHKPSKSKPSAPILAQVGPSFGRSNKSYLLRNFLKLSMLDLR